MSESKEQTRDGVPIILADGDKPSNVIDVTLGEMVKAVVSMIPQIDDHGGRCMVVIDCIKYPELKEFLDPRIPPSDGDSFCKDAYRIHSSYDLVDEIPVLVLNPSQGFCGIRVFSHMVDLREIMK